MCLCWSRRGVTRPIAAAEVSASESPGAKHRSKIRFVLDGEVIEIDEVDPTRTVLQFLREDLKRCGTKEGCAEGDCGACTVVLAETDHSGKQLRQRAINSCIQFLPTLDGKELITVESLAAEDGALHPVQKALVDCHGSQCGFCTPGFVMSLYALYENKKSPTRNDIDIALAGNLCRCTGYKPIVDAAMQMYAEPSISNSSTTDADRCAVLQSLQANDMLVVSGAQRKFFAPKNVQDLAQAYAENPAATLLAGGTDVGLWVTKQHRELDVVIYTGDVAELRHVDESDVHIEIGAAVSLTDAMQVIVEHYPTLEELFVRFASPPIRNAGTLGGNVANGSPIGDSMPALLVLDASLQIGCAAGIRTLSLHDFYLGYQQTALQDGEFVSKIMIPLPLAGAEVASYKVSKRFDQDISAICGAYRVMLDGDRVADIKIAYGGMAAIPQRAGACEEALIGKEWSEETVLQASRELTNDFTPISDMRSSADYRQQVAQNLLLRFFHESISDDADRVYMYGR
jgi:xanthine dehydrogenase small subunit